MTNSQKLKQKFDKTTEQAENKIREAWANYHPYYGELEPYQRGLILIALVAFLIFAIHYLTQKEQPEPRELTDTEKKEIEARAEERILRRMDFLKKLRA